MEYLLKMLSERRLEIFGVDFLMHCALYLFTIATIAIYAVAVVTNNVEIYKLVPVLCLSLVVFVVARSDFLIHRSQAYVRYVEFELPKTEQVVGVSGAPIQSWETWKSERKNTWLLGLLDAVGAAVLLYALWKSEQQLLNFGCYWFVAVTVVCIVGVAVCIPKIIHMAGR